MRPLKTPAQRWRFRRDVVIYVAHQAGISQRVLADVFDLPRSRIAVVIAQIAELKEERSYVDELTSYGPHAMQRPGTGRGRWKTVEKLA